MTACFSRDCFRIADVVIRVRRKLRRQSGYFGGVFVLVLLSLSSVNLVRDSAKSSEVGVALSFQNSFFLFLYCITAWFNRTMLPVNLVLRVLKKHALIYCENK